MTGSLQPGAAHWLPESAKSILRVFGEYFLFASVAVFFFAVTTILVPPPCAEVSSIRVARHPTSVLELFFTHGQSITRLHAEPRQAAR